MLKILFCGVIGTLIHMHFADQKNAGGLEFEFTSTFLYETHVYIVDIFLIAT